jgi:hypothetical protein
MRKQINLSIYTTREDDVAILAALEQYAGECGLAVSEAAKRIVSAALLGTEVATEVAQPPQEVAVTGSTELIQAMTEMTRELVALRKQVADMKVIQDSFAATQRQRTPDIPLREPEPVYTEEDVELHPIFVSALKRAARPGMRMEQ